MVMKAELTFVVLSVLIADAVVAFTCKTYKMDKNKKFEVRQSQSLFQ